MFFSFILFIYYLKLFFTKEIKEAEAMLAKENQKEMAEKTVDRNDII